MDTGLKGKTVLITGATRNHGRASAIAFAEEGANLLLCTRSSMDMLEETAELASKSGVKVVTGACDVTDEAQVEAFVQKGLDEFGHVDVDFALHLTAESALGVVGCGDDAGFSGLQAGGDFLGVIADG